MAHAAGDDPYQAVQRWAEPIREAVRCVTQTPLSVRGYIPGKIHVMTFPNFDIVPLTRLENQSRLHLVLRQHYRVIESADHPDRPWQVSVVGYMYTIQDRDGREIVSYHWHPDQQSPVTWPHLHVGVAAAGEGATISRRDLPAIHFPTRFITPADIIRLALTQLDVRPLRDDWEQVLART